MSRRHGIGKFFYWLRYRVGELCLRGFFCVFPWIPGPLLRFMARGAGRITLVVFRKYRKRMEENVAMALEKEILTSEDKRTLVLKAWKNFVSVVLETSFAALVSKHEILKKLSIEGEQHLKKALAKGKGVIALSAHLGNFSMIGIALAAAGYPFNVVVKQPRDQRFGRLLDHYRALVEIKTISSRPRREAARQVLRALRKNEVVLLIADEFKAGGVEVEFLGRKVRAQRGPVTLAMRTGASLVPMFLTRDQDDRLTLHIGVELDLIDTGDVQGNVDANVRLFTRQLEMMVRRYPEQWNWLGFPENGTGTVSPIPHPSRPDSESRI